MMRYLMCIALLYCASGCYTAEGLIKAGFKLGLDATSEWASSKVGNIPDEAVEWLKNKGYEGIDRVMEFSAEKAADAADAGFFAALKAAGTNPWDFDTDGDGKLSEVERENALNAAKEKDEKPWYAGILLAGATLLFTGGKSWRRYKKEKEDERARAVAEEVYDAEG